MQEAISEIVKDLKHSSRPLTAQEIMLRLRGSKSEANLYKELKNLMNLGIIKKVKFECEGYKIVKRNEIIVIPHKANL